MGRDPEMGSLAKAAAAWATALRLQDCPRDVGFAYLGGSSIQAIEVAFAIERAFPSLGTVRPPLQNPTLDEYVEILQRSPANGTWRALGFKPSFNHLQNLGIK